MPKKGFSGESEKAAGKGHKVLNIGIRLYKFIKLCWAMLQIAMCQGGTLRGSCEKRRDRRDFIRNVGIVGTYQDCRDLSGSSGLSGRGLDTKTKLWKAKQSHRELGGYWGEVCKHQRRLIAEAKLWKASGRQGDQWHIPGGTECLGEVIESCGTSGGIMVNTGLDCEAKL